MAHDPVLVENTAAWFRKALQDLRRVERCLTEESPDLEDALFHCQQAAEKALKALLTWHDEPFKKTHDLAALGNQCKQIENSLDRLFDRLDDLSEYAWAYRYPTSLAEPTSPEVDEASALAHMILDELEKRLPPEVISKAKAK
jgi:HEPN domain-containing protein